MSGFIGPRPSDVPVGTISTSGTISGNNIVVGGATVNSTVFTGTANNSTYAFGKTEGNLNVNSAVYANSSSTNTFTVGTSAYFVSNGNVGINTTTPEYKLQVSNGSFGITGTANSNISFVEAGATFNSGYVASYINPSMSAVANSDYLFAQSIYPSFNPNGVNTPSLMGVYNNPKIANSSSANGMTLINNYNICSRDSDNDSVTGSIFLYGSLNTVGHNNSSNTSKSYTSTIAYGTANLLTNMNGSIGTIYGTSNIIRIATAANRTANATTAYGFYTTATVGATSGTGTGTLTNYYDAYLAGVTVNATGTVTNKYGIYQVKTDHINYFGGKVGIGNTSPSYTLDVTNSTLTSITAGRCFSPANSAGYSATYFRAEKGDGYGGALGGWINQGVNSGLVLATQSAGTLTERLWIDNTGRVGIGTSTPNDKLTIYGANTVYSDTVSGGASGTNSDWAYHKVTVGGTYSGSLYNLIYGGGVGYTYYSPNNGQYWVGTSQNSPLILYTNNVERMRIGTSGVQSIQFAPTQVSSADANTLDDYEEGSWTPVAASSAGSLTSYTSAGKYIKIGNQVWVSCRVTLINVGTASGSMSLSGFPFTSGTGHQTPTLVREEAYTGLMYQAFIFNSGTTGNILNRDNGAISWTNNYVYVFQLTYTV